MSPFTEKENDDAYGKVLTGSWGSLRAWVLSQEASEPHKKATGRAEGRFRGGWSLQEAPLRGGTVLREGPVFTGGPGSVTGWVRPRHKLRTPYGKGRSIREPLREGWALAGSPRRTALQELWESPSRKMRPFTEGRRGGVREGCYGRGRGAYGDGTLTARLTGGTIFTGRAGSYRRVGSLRREGRRKGLREGWPLQEAGRWSLQERPGPLPYRG